MSSQVLARQPERMLYGPLSRGIIPVFLPKAESVNQFQLFSHISFGAFTLIYSHHVPELSPSTLGKVITALDSLIPDWASKFTEMRNFWWAKLFEGGLLCAPRRCSVVHSLKRQRMNEKRHIKERTKPLPQPRASITFPPKLYRTLEILAKEKKVSIAWVDRKSVV